MAEYEGNVKWLQTAAKWVVRLYGAGRQVAVVAGTWATAGLLGSYGQQLHPWEMGLIVTLVVLAISPFYAANVFARLLTGSLAPLSQEPPNLTFRPEQDPLPRHASRLRLICFLVQFLFSLTTIAISTACIYPLRLRLHLRHNHKNQLHLGFFSFYIATIVAASLFLSAAVLYAFPIVRFSADLSLVRYYDYILGNAFKSCSKIWGFQRCSDSDFFRFAYVDLLGSECRRNAQPRVMASQYQEILRYLYEADRSRAMEQLFHYLESLDAAVELAAANVVGIWLSEEMGLGINDAASGMPVELVKVLLEKIGRGQVGWAAANSLAAMAESKEGQVRLLELGTTVGDELAGAMEPASGRSLVLVRAMVYLVHGQVKDLKDPPDSAVLWKIFSENRLEKLKEDLGMMMRSGKFHRIRVLAAYLYFLLGLNPSAVLPEGDAPLWDINPKSDNYWLLSEKEMLEQLYRRFAPPTSVLPEFPEEIRQNRVMTAPIWGQRPFRPTTMDSTSTV